jgi:hypothetical protein
MALMYKHLLILAQIYWIFLTWDVSVLQIPIGRGGTRDQQKSIFTA